MREEEEEKKQGHTQLLNPDHRLIPISHYLESQ
jgi:hypothetical protein